MNDDPYWAYRRRELTLADQLAIDRTVLANQRTLLSFARTALGLGAVGGSCIKFFDALWIELVGVAFLVAGVVVAVIGWRSFRKVQRLLASARERRDAEAESETPPTDPPPDDAAP